jgi:hypothetical protein
MVDRIGAGRRGGSAAANCFFLDPKESLREVLDWSPLYFPFSDMAGLDQGGRTRHDFSLAWLEAVCHCSGSGHGPTRNEPV